MFMGRAGVPAVGRSWIWGPGSVYLLFAGGHVHRRRGSRLALSRVSAALSVQPSKTGFWCVGLIGIFRL